MRQVPTIFAIFVAIFGGIYFGLFSCGGYVWHKQAFLAVLVACTSLALVVPLSRTSPYLTRLGLVFGVVCGFVVSRAMAAPFYPAVPESWSAFFGAFARALVHGPC